MLWIALGLALLLACAIIVIGLGYVARPLAMIGGFGLPLPDTNATTAPWLRLKGVRDITSGLVVLGVMIWGQRHDLGLVLLLEAVIPLGDMLVILTAKGSRAAAFGMHGVTAAVMVLTALALLIGVR